MPFIEPIDDESAGAEAAALLAEAREQQGFVPNYARAFAHQPAIYAAWRQLVGALTRALDPRLYELATLAAACELRSTYCALAHGKVLADRFLPPETVAGAARDHHDADLDELDVSVMDLAAKVARDATSVTEDDVDRLRRHGLSDADVVAVVAAAAARSFFAKTLDALGVGADALYAELDPDLRDALVFARPIATA
jgi:uncharacterized peroxidase-related enzyme